MSGPFEYMVERLLWERAETVLMYHGTGERNLKSILSRGLLPTGVPKAWADDPNISWVQPSRTSLGGIYLTHNLMTAISSSWKGTDVRGGEKRIIVICQIQPRSLLADEDDFMHIVKGLEIPRVVATEWSALHLYVSAQGTGQSDEEPRFQQDYRNWLDTWVDEKARRIMFQLKDEPHPQLGKRLRDVLRAGFPATVKRFVAHIGDNYITRQVADARETEIELPSKAEGERGFQRFLDQLTRTMKSVAQISKRSSDFSVSGRLMKPIKFRGANKIVGVFAFYDDEERRSIIEPVFGRIPQETVREWEQRMGEWRRAA